MVYHHEYSISCALLTSLSPYFWIVDCDDKDFWLVSFPKSIGILNSSLEPLCRFSVCFSKFATKGYFAPWRKTVNLKIVTEVGVSECASLFPFTEIVFCSLFISHSLSLLFITIDVQHQITPAFPPPAKFPQTRLCVEFRPLSSGKEDIFIPFPVRSFCP